MYDIQGKNLRHRRYDIVGSQEKSYTTRSMWQESRWNHHVLGPKGPINPMWNLWELPSLSTVTVPWCSAGPTCVCMPETCPRCAGSPTLHRACRFQAPEWAGGDGCLIAVTVEVLLWMRIVAKHMPPPTPLLSWVRVCNSFGIQPVNGLTQVMGLVKSQAGPAFARWHEGSEQL